MSARLGCKKLTGGFRIEGSRDTVLCRHALCDFEDDEEKPEQDPAEEVPVPETEEEAGIRRESHFLFPWSAAG